MKYINLKILPNLIVLSIILSSCHNIRKDDRNAVLNLTGKEIILPDSLGVMIQDVPVEYDFSFADYKVVTYIDSKGCTTCSMKLTLWNDLINEFKTIEGIDVNFLMILNKDADVDLISALKLNFFRHPVMFDPQGRFKEKNSLPSSPAYHTMLLDSDNKVVAVGNPVLSPKIKDLYRQILTENGTERSSELCQKPVVALGVVNAGDSVVRQFNLVNNGKDIWNVQGITTSCDCISATISSEMINPGDTAVLTMSFLADTIPGYFSKYADIYFQEKENSEHLLVHGFIVNCIN